MSDSMLHGVLNMPIEVWNESEVSKFQRYSRYIQASNLIKAQQEFIAELEKFKAEHTPLLSYLAIESACNISDFKGWLATRDLEQQIKGINALQESIETTFKFSMCSIEDIMHYKILEIKKQIDEVKHNAKL